MIKPVSLTWSSNRPLAEMRSWVAESLCADTLLEAGYRVVSGSKDELILTKAESTGWIFPLSVAAYLLTSKRPYRVVFRFVALADGRNQVLVIGDLPTKVVGILRELTDAAPRSGR